MKKRRLQKFLTMLTIYSIASSTNASTINDLKDALDSRPPMDARYKLVYDYPDGNGWVLHNSFRERQIKTKLYACKEADGLCAIQQEAYKQYKNACTSFQKSCDEYRKLALDIKPEVVLFKNPKWIIGGVVLSLGIGVIAGIMIAK